MPTTSAGILLYRQADPEGVAVFLAHMGGPFWSGKDEAAWSIPKGEYDEGEDPHAVARREFEEEIGVPAPALDYRLLGEFRQSSRKTIMVFAAPYTGDLGFVQSNTFELEWPPRSGRRQSFPEVDDAQWFPSDVAEVKLVKGQRPVLAALRALIADEPG
ncbi:NUDIX domain-containing protein [Aldersonia sp. NBC_00410]|uniref:NUDIX domain-containing protein n=1 Tax=Aldersonia sp. NBC_00410 TaxID=2975954 RepID=UPI00224FBD5D|nr:NUDIX domain-containing protein [Aldersonia sp. NBC_00410]MCX5044784.1 NUDIX domain-containing protein [Aldersonia sp. NBC_00410]